MRVMRLLWPVEWIILTSTYRELLVYTLHLPVLVSSLISPLNAHLPQFRHQYP